MSTEENIVLSENISQEVQTPPPAPQEIRLVDMVVTDENVALNILVSFVSLAQQRGAFRLEESAKIWECIQLFQKKN